jgi:hypothetical protein
VRTGMIALEQQRRSITPPHLFSHRLALNIMWIAWSLRPAPLGAPAPAPPAGAAAAAAAAAAAEADRYSSIALPVTVPLRSGKRQSSAGVWQGLCGVGWVVCACAS